MQQNNSSSDISFKLICEMNKKAQELVELMKKDIVEFIFKKASTGEMRKAHGTLDPKRIPAEARRKRGRPRYRPDYLVIYYDTDKKAIRSFKDFLLQKINLKKSKKSIISKKNEDGNSGKKEKTKDAKREK